MPILQCAAEQICNQNKNIWWNFYIPVVETTEKYLREITTSYCFKPELVPSADRYKLFEKTDIAIAASGTVTAELAIMHVPTIVIYRMNPFTEFLVRIFVKIKWASLVNILLKKSVYPELLGNNATPENIAMWVKRLLQDKEKSKMISDLKRADKLWTRGGKSPAKLIAADILKSK